MQNEGMKELNNFMSMVSSGSGHAALILNWKKNMTKLEESIFMH